MSEDAINRLGEDTAPLIAKDSRPIRAMKVQYYRDRALKKLVGKTLPSLLDARAEDGVPETAEAEKAKVELAQFACGFLGVLDTARNSVIAQAA